MLKLTLLGQLKYFLSCAAYAVGCAAYANGCAAYAVVCAPSAVGCAASVRQFKKKANSVQLWHYLIGSYMKYSLDYITILTRCQHI